MSEAVWASIPEDLGEGERTAIALAVARGADLVILDDQEGRRAARAEGLAVTGTIGVLIETREAGHIDSLRGCTGSSRRRGVVDQRDLL